MRFHRQELDCPKQGNRMNPAEEKKRSRWTRREFLATGTAAATGGLLVEKSVAQVATRPAKKPKPTRLTYARWDRIVVGRTLHPSLLREMFGESLLALTNQATVADAWHRLFEPDDIIAIKANHSGASVIGTVEPCVDALVKSLTEAGWAPEQIVLLEVPARTERGHKTLQARRGWQNKEVDFGSGKDQLAAVLDQVTAIVNLPFIKTHNIAGMTCGLKNLSHGLVKHPARYHGNGCSPYIGDIVSSPQIRDKLKLTIVNAFRVVFHGGPEAVEQNVAPASRLIMGTDPVAVDTLALKVLDQIRGTKGLRPVGKGGPFLDYLDRAAERGLGTNDLDFIDVKVINMEE
jgi:hypothetical protein